MGMVECLADLRREPAQVEHDLLLVDGAHRGAGNAEVAAVLDVDDQSVVEDLAHRGDAHFAFGDENHVAGFDLLVHPAGTPGLGAPSLQASPARWRDPAARVDPGQGAHGGAEAPWASCNGRSPWNSTSAFRAP